MGWYICGAAHQCGELCPSRYRDTIADASGVDGEGLQIGNGTVDFNNILKIIKKSRCDQSFIPEIWQGHKNYGEGFWIALKKLENKL